MSESLSNNVNHKCGFYRDGFRVRHVRKDVESRFRLESEVNVTTSEAEEKRLQIAI